ncbi:MAG: DUF5906 domain-containing protein [Candidatus Gracilibacteria bacterium]
MNKKDREKLEELSKKINETYVYIKSLAKFYCPKYKKFFKANEVATNMLITYKDLILLRKGQIIKTYDELCYYRGGKKGCYNLLDESKILIPSENPILDPNIKKLIDNVCGYKKDNIEYLHKLILFKYTHLNEFNIPAVVLYGVGGSGKGTIINLFGTMLGKENVWENLGQENLNSSFSVYKGEQFIVEFAEITRNSINQDMRILNKLKNLVLSPTHTVNLKGINHYKIDNVALFFISSNSNTPIQLDSKEKGNRRFTIIKSLSALSTQEGNDINKTIKDKKSVQNYLCWLMINFPEMIKTEKIDVLDNQDKKDLEEKSQSDANQFWEWFEEKYPDKKGKILIQDLNKEINNYLVNELDYEYFERNNFKRFFWKTSRYEKKKMRFKDINNSRWGVEIK